MDEWTKEEENYIAVNYLTMTDAEMGEHLRRTMMAVRTRRYKLNLRIPKTACDGDVWERVTKWIKREHAEAIAARMAAQGVAVKVKHGKRGEGKGAATYGVWRKMSREKWLILKGKREPIHPIPKTPGFAIADKNHWDVQPTPIHTSNIQY